MMSARFRMVSVSRFAVSSTSYSARICERVFFSSDLTVPLEGIRGLSGLPGRTATYSDPMKVGLSTVTTVSCRKRL